MCVGQIGLTLKLNLVTLKIRASGSESRSLRTLLKLLVIYRPLPMCFKVTESKDGDPSLHYKIRVTVIINSVHWPSLLLSSDI